MANRLPYLLALAVLSCTMLPAPATAKEGASFYESLVLEDTDGDYASNGGLDIVAIYASERDFADESGLGHRKLLLRLELRNRDELRSAAAPSGETVFNYTVGYTAGGTASTVQGQVKLSCSVTPQQGLTCTPPSPLGPIVVDTTGSITLILDLDEAGLAPGVVLTNLWAASVSFKAGQAVYEDVVPKDNQNIPSGPEADPAETQGQYALTGTFPFLTLDSVMPPVQYGVAANEAVFTVVLNTTAVSTPETILMFFTAPPGWKVETNLGGEFLIGNNPNTTIEVDVKATPPDLAAAGDIGAITVDAFLRKSGGHVSFPLMVNVCPMRCEIPSYEFALLNKGPFQKGKDATVQAKVAYLGQPANRYPVTFEANKGPERVGPFAGKFLEAGVYETIFNFPSEGEWTVDVFVEDRPPFALGQFKVNVEEKGGVLPGFDPVAFLVVLGAALLAVRRRA